MIDSRIPAFYKLPLAARRALIAERTGIPLDRLEQALETGGLTPGAADKTVENVLGVYAVPFGIALNLCVNGSDRLVPMVVEEPSVIAAASNAARMVREGGGFVATCPESLMTGQIELREVRDTQGARERLLAAGESLVQLGREAVPGLVQRGGGPRSIAVRALDESTLVVDVQVDCRNAMGANLVNTVAESIGPRCAELAEARLGLRILSNLCDHRRVEVTCHIPVQHLVAVRGRSNLRDLQREGSEVAAGIAQASRFAELDPYRAATHNKGIMNGIDAVVLATGNDFRAVEAGAHAYACRDGRYRPLATWRHSDDELHGRLELPLALGVVGGTLRVHPTARLALDILRVRTAEELAMVAASAGLASNLAALRALATDGIQKGHMALHARSVAVAAGAADEEVEQVAQAMVDGGRISVEVARGVLERLRSR